MIYPHKQYNQYPICKTLYKRRLTNMLQQLLKRQFTVLKLPGIYNIYLSKKLELLLEQQTGTTKEKL